MRTLSDKVVVVTGASAGIGRAAARGVALARALALARGVATTLTPRCRLAVPLGARRRR